MAPKSAHFSAACDEWQKILNDNKAKTPQPANIEASIKTNSECQEVIEPSTPKELEDYEKRLLEVWDSGDFTQNLPHVKKPLREIFDW